MYRYTIAGWDIEDGEAVNEVELQVFVTGDVNKVQASTINELEALLKGKEMAERKFYKVGLVEEVFSEPTAEDISGDDPPELVPDDDGGPEDLRPKDKTD